MKRVLWICISFSLLLVITIQIFASDENDGLHNNDSVVGITSGQENPRTTTITPLEAVAETGSSIFTGRSGLFTVVCSNGTISVMDRVNAIVYEFSSDMELVRTLHFDKPLAEVGAFTRDDDGNFFIFFAQNVAEGATTERNMVLIKYSPDGDLLMEHWHEAGIGFNGVKSPFASGTARIEISGDMIAIYFARLMFRLEDGLNHQASWGFVLDVNTFERMSGPGGTVRIPYVSHSFNQFILPVENGFVIADHGDGFPRAFSFSRIALGEANRRIDGFRFAGAIGENYTGASMGELAQTSSGFLFSGNWDSGTRGNARNLFLLTINDDMSEISDPIWITNYTRNSPDAHSPKLVQIDESEYLLLWEESYFVSPSPNVDGQFVSWVRRTMMAIVDENGNVISPAQEIGWVELNGNDVLRFCDITRRVYWAVRAFSGDIVLYSLDPRAEISSAPLEPYFTVSFDPGYGQLPAGVPYTQIHPYGNLLRPRDVPLYNLPTPTRAGYHFVGWQWDDAVINTWPRMVRVRQDMNLLAYWVPISDRYIIRFYSYGDLIRYEYVLMGERVWHVPSVSEPGYTFYGWRITSPDHPEYNEVVESWSILFMPMSSSVTFDAVWVSDDPLATPRPTPIPTPTPTPSIPPPPVIPGDVNGDGVVTAADVALLRAYLAGHTVDICPIAANVTGSGTLSAADVALLRAYLAGHPVELLTAP